MKKRLTDVYSVESKIRFFPFIKDFKKYKLKILKDDFIAAISVVLLTIPQSIAYSLLANLPAQAGIFTAIFGSIFSGAFGSSRHLIAGPSTGVSILIQTILANLMYVHFPDLMGVQREMMILQLLMQIVFIVGFLQILFAFFNVSKILHFVSRSVILGYFAGVGIAIIVNQLFYLLGIRSIAFTSSVIMKAIFLFKHLNEINGLTLLVGLLSILILISLNWKFKKFPNALIMVVLIALFVYYLNFFMLEHQLRIPLLADFGMTKFPAIQLVIPFFDFKYLDIIFFPALAIALLCVLEVASISKGVATRSGQKIKTNQEIFGLGLANFVLSFFYTAMPSSASVSRTTLNFTAGAKTRFAAIISGLMVTILIFFFWPFVNHIPLCALSAILIIMVLSVVEIRHVKLCFRASHGDAFVFSLTMAGCLLFRLDIAFFIGILISIIFFLRRAAVPHLVEYTFDKKDKLIVVLPKRKSHKKIRIIGISGELFFAAVDLVQNTLQKIVKEPDVQVIILRLQNIYDVDASICLAILRLNDYLKSTDRYLLISGITEEVWYIFQKAGVVKQLGQDKLFLTDVDNPQLSTKKALHKAETLIN